MCICFIFLRFSLCFPASLAAGDAAIRGLHNNRVLDAGMGPMSVKYATGEAERLGLSAQVREATPTTAIGDIATATEGQQQTQQEDIFLREFACLMPFVLLGMRARGPPGEAVRWKPPEVVERGGVEDVFPILWTGQGLMMLPLVPHTKWSSKLFAWLFVLLRFSSCCSAVLHLRSCTHPLTRRDRIQYFFLF